MLSGASCNPETHRNVLCDVPPPPLLFFVLSSFLFISHEDYEYTGGTRDIEEKTKQDGKMQNARFCASDLGCLQATKMPNKAGPMKIW